MLLDIGTVLGGIGLAVVAFLVVILVCVVILRLLAAILPSYEDRDAVAAAREELRAGADEATPEEVAEPAEGGATSETPVPSPEEVGGAGESGE
jgi:hypothetical protein